LKIESRIIRKFISDIKRNPILHFITSSTVIVSIVIIGVFFLFYRNFEIMSEKASPQVIGTVYLKGSLKENELLNLREKLLFLENVENVKHKTRDNVLEEIASFLGSSNISYISESFPDVMEVTLKKDTSKIQIEALSKIIAAFDEVSEVDFSSDWLEKYEKVKSILKLIFISFSSIVFLGCVFITANFMGVRQEARKKEIDIARLVGANDAFIFKPLFLEGIIEGLISAFLAVIFLYIIKTIVSTAMMTSWSSFFEFENWVFLSTSQIICLFVFSILINSFGTIMVFFRFKEKTL